MKALITKLSEDSIQTAVEETPLKLEAGNVTVRVEWSALNYKDALALSGRGKIMRQLPMVGGIDLAGTVAESEVAEYAVGDRVLVNGFGLSQTHDGGYAEFARVPAEWLVPVPEKFDTRDAMAIGTAGFTSMLSLQALEHAGVTPAKGPVLVTGANGGVGSIAVALLSGQGYEVVASTGRLAESDFLSAMGATSVMDRKELSSAVSKPLGSERWAGAIDSVGSHTLANVLAQTRYGGAVAACGLAQGMDLPTSMAPFILRGVTLAGIDSVNAPKSRRLDAWARLASDLDIDKLAAATNEIELGEVPGAVADLFAGKIRGRTVVRVA